ncbi:helix-turn-helix transcriptional regulator [Tamlana crocina]|uniref:Helix-turn-helix transcriptional regulator n=1 Tax=Tamlana crocina TaxID=393006 RepID=A0ABX1D8K3_9FLAO|nr:AraC family transcriptional regulator [Tamlana crocina]NJX14700.1 helix-turn-helix transcriptional regulator [Tamlana crocina]
MEKKRRETENFETVDLTKEQCGFKDFISKKDKQHGSCGLLTKEYSVLPEFGKGHIIEFCFEDVSISINQFTFHKNFKFHNDFKLNGLYLSFLLKGDMVVQINSQNEEIPYDEKESFMAYVETVNGTFKFYKNQLFKGIKIRVGKDFLKKHGLNDISEFKQITEENLIIPITDEVLPVIENLQQEHGRGLVKRLHLGAKVIEVIALQLENYKNLKQKHNAQSNQKYIKKLFLLKQFLKANLNQNYAIIELANEIGLSENILKSEFKRTFNCTVNQYFLEQKMEKAKSLLQNTDSPIYEISEVVGYKNATHFSAAFKRFYNETPKNYRLKV